MLAMLCLAGASCNRDPEARKQKYYQSAMDYLNRGKANEAAIQLRNALKVDPKFADAANILAELEARRGNFREAFTLLQKAENDNPDFLPARKGLAQLYRMAGKFAEAQAEVDYILERAPEDTDALFSLGAIQTSQKKYTEAEGTFNRILEIQPGSVQAFLALASVKEKQKDAGSAERYLKQALERNPRSVAVYLSLIRFYLAAGRGAEAEPLFAQALKVSNNAVQILEAQAGYYEGLGKLQEAEQVAQRIQLAHASDPKYWSAVADFYVRTGNWAKARAEFERLSALHKGDRTLQHKLIEVHLSMNDRKGAEALNQALLKDNPKDGYGLMVKGRLYLQSGQTDQALAQFNQAHQYQPDFLALYYWYAKAYLQRNELGLAKQYFDNALKQDPGYSAARRELAELLNQTSSPDAAISNARRLLQDNPADVRAMLIYSQALINKQEFPEARKIINAVAGRAPNDAELHRQLGILSLVEKNVPVAEKEFKRAWELQPQSRSLLEAVLMGYVVDKQAPAGSDFLRSQIQARSKDPLLYHELAQIYLLLGKQAEAVAALKQALTLAPGYADAALLLADTYASAGQPDAALQLVNGVMQSSAKNPNAVLRAGMVLEKLQRWDEAQKAYELVLQLDNDEPVAKNNLASLLVSRGGNIDVALTLAQQAKERLPDNVQVTATIGWIYYQKKAYKTALDYLKE